MASFIPAEVFPPGVIIRDELRVRGWTQGDLAEVMERPLAIINQIIGAKKRVTEDTAKELEAALGIDAEFWLRMESLYRLRHGPPVASTIERRSALRRRVPLRFMVSRGWIDPTDDVSEMEAAVKGYLGISSLDEKPSFAMAAKQTAYNRPLSSEQEVWLLRTKKLAESMLLPAYSADKLKRAVDALRGCLSSPDDVRHVPKLLADAGVRFVVVERLPGLGIDGVCFWLSPTKPVIGMSLTRDRIDNFWFVLRHEIEHVLNGDGKDGAIIDNDLDEAVVDDISVQERLANSAAAEFCVPQIELIDWMKRKGPLFTYDNIWQFARSLGLHPGLVAGQLRKRLSQGPVGKRAWRMFTPHLAKVRAIITSTALVDGFGCSPQVG